MMYSHLWKGLLWVVVFILPMLVHAAGVVRPSCSVSSIPLNFSIYWGKTALTSQTTISVNCTLPTTTQVQMDAGLHSANFISRKMAASVRNTINYNLYTNFARSRVWGDGTNGTFTLTGNRLTVYASIPAGQVVKAGTYADTVVVTIVW